MNVAIFSETRYWGGLEVHAVALAKVLVEAGHAVSLVCIGAKTRRVYEPRLPDGVDLIELAEPVSRSVWAWWRTLRRVEADAVVLEKGTLWTGGLALDLVLRLKYRRFIAVQHLEPPDLPPKPARVPFGRRGPALGLWWFKWKWRGYARSLAPTITVCVSETVRERLIAQYAFAPDRVMTIRNGVDASVFRPDPAVRRQVRQEWGLPQDGFVFGSVGRLSRQKGLDVALEAFRELVGTIATRRPVYLVLVGDGSERPALVEQARSLGLSDRVLLPGFTSTPSASYQGFDIFLLPSRYEGLPFSLIEAMASGCRVIGTAVGGIPEVITDPDLGTLVQSEDPNALASAMRQVLHKDPQASARETHIAREHVAKHFDVRTQCSRIVSLLAGASGGGAEMALRRARATR